MIGSPASIRIDRPARSSDNAERGYFMVAGRLWRSTNPALPTARRQDLVADLMDARRMVKEAKGGSLP
ncbi:hypothetical protein AB4099_34165 [Bosea sp. 2KB_26]|uniref:hypothetical protein n=1 Tax=Bosea sp. 2KB_26 TaxID=3237475 RepID=UPI003F924080